MSDSLRRLAPLTGIPFAILLAYTFFGSPSSPNIHDTGVQVIQHYNDHHSGHLAGDLVGGLAIIFFLFFITSLRSYFKNKPGADGLSMAALVGGIFIGMGGAIFSSLDFALADDYRHIGPQAAQAINVLSNEFFFPFEIGLVVFAISIGLAIVASGALPKWLGWVMVVIGVVALSPIGYFGFFVILLWSAIVSVLVYRRLGPSTAATTT
jgi:hypothetical protein